ncbi:hypothetical protein K2X05_01060 [bacterium]|nr:hypothetical protein [bacterium]
MIFSNPFKTTLDPHSLSKFVCSFFCLILCFETQAQEKKRATILPLITFYSTLQDGEVYNWWAENDSLGDMKVLSEKFHNLLANQPLSRWQYLPLKDLQKSSEPEWQISNMTDEKKLALAKIKGAVLVVTGDVRVIPSPLIAEGVRITQRLEVLRLKNSEKIGESLKIFDLPKHQYQQMLLSSDNHSKEFVQSAFFDLHEKIELYKADKAIAQTRLVLTGVIPDFHLENLRQKIQTRLPNIKSIHTVSMEREQVTLLVEGASSEQLSQTLVGILWKGLRTQVVSTDASQVVFDVRLKNSVN